MYNDCVIVPFQDHMDQQFQQTHQKEKKAGNTTKNTLKYCIQLAG